MSPRLRRLAAPLSTGALVLASAAYVGLVDPNAPGHYPLCPTKALTGLDCPGCGGLRACHSLVTGDLVGALDHNAFVVLVLLPLAVVAWVLWLVRAWRGPQTPATSAAAGRSSGPARGVLVPGGGPLPPASATATVHAPPAAGVPKAAPAPGSRVLWALLILGLVFTVVRNISAVPAFAWLGSGLS